MTQRVFDAFVFDLDGTLVDTSSELIAAYQKLCMELGGGEKPLDDAWKLISQGSGRLVTEATGIGEGDPRWELYRQQYLDCYGELLGSTAEPFDGLVTVLKAAHSAGKKWGVVTNKFRRFAEPLMNEMPFEPSAGVLVTPCDVTHAKPHPEPVLLAAAELSVSPKAMVYIGDHIRDIESGNAAGCFTVAVKYGYIEDHDNAEHWGADLCVDSPQALCQWIRNQL